MTERSEAQRPSGAKRSGTGDATERLREGLAREVPCVCGPEYTGRNLRAPECQHHEAMAWFDEDLAPLVVRLAEALRAVDMLAERSAIDEPPWLLPNQVRHVSRSALAALRPLPDMDVAEGHGNTREGTDE